MGKRTLSLIISLFVGVVIGLLAAGKPVAGGQRPAGQDRIELDFSVAPGETWIPKLPVNDRPVLVYGTVSNIIQGGLVQPPFVFMETMTHVSSVNKTMGQVFGAPGGQAGFGSNFVPDTAPGYDVGTNLPDNEPGFVIVAATGAPPISSSLHYNVIMLY
jgi:hypothetical protein